MTDVILDPSVQKQRERIRRQEQVSLTLSERLTRQAKDRTATIMIGEIPVEIRVPLAAEFDQLLSCQRRIMAGAVKGNLKEQEKHSVELAEILASLTTDESLNKEFFMSGQIGIDDQKNLVDGIMEEVVNRVSQAREFRRDTGGGGVTPDVPITQ